MMMEYELFGVSDVEMMRDILLCEPLNPEGFVEVMRKVKDHVLVHGDFSSDLQPAMLLDRCNRQLNEALGQYVFAKDGIYIGDGTGAKVKESVQLMLQPLLRARAIRLARGKRWGKTRYYAGAALRKLGDLEYRIPDELIYEFYDAIDAFDFSRYGVDFDSVCGERSLVLKGYEAKYDSHRKLIKVVRL